MCLSTLEAAVIVNKWPERLSSEQKLTLMSQLTRIQLPTRIVESWQKETSK